MTGMGSVRMSMILSRPPVNPAKSFLLPVKM